PDATPEAPHQPPRRQERRRITDRLVRDEHRVPGDEAALEPEPLAPAQRGDVLELAVRGLALRHLEHAPEPRSPARFRFHRRRDRRPGPGPPGPAPPRTAPPPPSRHAAHRPRPNAGSTAPPPASTTAAGFPTRIASRTVYTDPRDGPHRNATTPADCRASRRERASSATRPPPTPVTMHPPCASNADNARSLPGRPPGRNTTDRAHAPAPAPTTAPSAYASAPRAPPDPIPHPRESRKPTTAATC